MNDVLSRLPQVVVILLLGYPPMIVAAYLPLLGFWALFLHANVPWDLGPLRYVIASPAFHRWHHSRDNDVQGKNLAGLVPFIDALFGTLHLPRDRRPTTFRNRRRSGAARSVASAAVSVRLGASGEAVTMRSLMLITLMLGSSCLRGTPVVPSDAAVAPYLRSVQVLGSLSAAGELEVGAGSSGERLRISVVPDPEGESPFPEDNFVLRVRPPRRTREPLEMDFVSTYGSFELALFDLTNDRVPDTILVTGVGRGTSVRQEVLRVFDCASGKLEVILEKVVSGWFGSGSHWSFQRSVLVNPFEDIALLRLVLEHDEPGHSPFEDATLIPGDAVLDYSYDTRAKVMRQIVAVRSHIDR